MRIVAVIPARFGSTRLPGKPLLDICGKPMIVRVFEKVAMAKALDAVIVATDDARIADAVKAAGGRAVQTPTCESGSDRVYKVALEEKGDVFINVQGDEPLLNPKALDALAVCMRSDKIPVATLATKLPNHSPRIMDPNCVKVVFDVNHNALYFSRSPIPYVRDQGTPASFYAHIGVYAYTREALTRFATLPVSPLERMEKLEQLRLLEAGIPIRVLETDDWGPGVDTERDLALVRARFAGESPKSLAGIRLIVTDVDGVLTDGTLTYGEQGECLKHFNAKDGLGIVKAHKHGIAIAVLSGRDSKALRKRLEDLSITHFRLGRLEKGAALQELLAEAGVSADEAVFLGDDETDIQGFQGCAMGVCVADAHPTAKAAADLVLETMGGHGALRELIDRICLEKTR
ncbi:MAG: 3-deoxy-manno-octulosonate cytidylyltransferase [Desulfovibrio sp.]|nr:3-deoxy-manno-octulosonate cytidylyltransferase [Desulfovibrio sp.]